jgi:hypothetical protein
MYLYNYILVCDFLTNELDYFFFVSFFELVALLCEAFLPKIMCCKSYMQNSIFI